ncbi:MAG: ribonuclease T [Gammaproteobacteria bacterium]
MNSGSTAIHNRFRGFLPVVVDVETGGLNPNNDALLEIAIVLLEMDEAGLLHCGKTHACHVKPFAGANLDPAALKLNKIDPGHPFRFAVEEKIALTEIFQPVQQAVESSHCQRAVLVGHNAWFDLLFIKAAVQRCKIDNNPFHSFTTFDTATLAAVFYGQTVLAKAVRAAKLKFNRDEAHSAIYDAECTAKLFCKMVNQWQTSTTSSSFGC